MANMNFYGFHLVHRQQSIKGCARHNEITSGHKEYFRSSEKLPVWNTMLDVSFNIGDFPKVLFIAANLLSNENRRDA